jgi:hypothetical protein
LSTTHVAAVLGSRKLGLHRTIEERKLHGSEQRKHRSHEGQCRSGNIETEKSDETDRP